jgi:hypothetical protein
MTGLALLSLLVLNTAVVSGSKECSSGCVTTHNYDQSRDDVNPGETILKASTLSSLKATASSDLHGLIYTQPLYVSNLAISKGRKNVVFVATEENWVYALDGDNVSKPPLWKTDLNNDDESSVPLSKIPPNCGNIAPEIGITGTPAIDLSENVLFVVSAHYNTDTQTVTQRFNALNLADGTAAAAPLDIPAAFQALGFDFDVTVQQQRAALAVDHDAKGNPLVYVAWASYCDTASYSGKVAAFSFMEGLSVLEAFDDEAAGGKAVVGPKGGIWMAGAAPAVAPPIAGKTPRVFLATGNGAFVPGTGYGQSVLRFGGGSSGPLDLTGSYTVNAWDILNRGSHKNCKSPLHMPPPYPSGTTICSPDDFELGSAGVMLARPSGTGNVPPGDTFVVLAGGKEGVFYVIDPSNMNHAGADTQDPCGKYAIQCFGAIQLPLPCCQVETADFGNRGEAAFWAGNSTYQENVLYVVGSNDSVIRAYQMNPGGGGTFNTSLFASAPPPNHNPNGLIPYSGSTPVITWHSTTAQPGHAILWRIQPSGSEKGKLFAFQAVPKTQGGTLPLLWSDTTRTPKTTRFMVPTVINGHVYVAGGKPNTPKCDDVGACLGRGVSWP